MPPKKTKSEKVQWTYQGKVIDHIDRTPEKSFAFIYKITLEDGRYYVGKKYMWKPSYTSGKNKGVSKGQYAWQSYCSSSIELKALIKEGFKYKKEILFFNFFGAKKQNEVNLKTEILINKYRRNMEDRNLGIEILLCIFAIIGIISTVNFIFS